MNRRSFLRYVVSVSIVFSSFGTPAEAASLSPQQKNVILIVPDGCSTAVWGMVRALTVGAEGQLNIDKLPVQSRCRTYAANSIITDSAASGTALACGVKTNNGIIGMDASTARGDSLSGQPIESIVESAEAAGFATGLITTTTIQHATPAAFYSHRADRNWYPLIATDLVGSGIDVVIGGGREYMIPRGSTDESGGQSLRRDNRNLIDEMIAEGYTYVSDSAGFSAVDHSSTDKLLGLFGYHALQPEYERQKSVNPEPPLWELTAKSLEILAKNPRGFFLMVEAGQIDWAAHDNDTVNLIGDAIACDKTVGAAAAFAKSNPNTLLIVVSDHGTGGPNLIGFYRSADPLSRTRSNESVGLRPFTLDENGFPVGLGDIPPAVGWSSSKYFLHTDSDGGEHTAEDVGIHAMGPCSEKLVGLMNNTDINKVMRAHLGL